MAFTMPWTPTTSIAFPFVRDGDLMEGAIKNLPSAFVPTVPPGLDAEQRKAYLSYVLFEKMSWLGGQGMIRTWRDKTLSLSKNFSRVGAAHTALWDKHVPMMYCYPEDLVPKCAGWGDEIDIVGYWFLDTAANYTPPEDLQAFLDAGEPPVYVGFGSIVCDAELAQQLVDDIVAGLIASGRRGLIARGWLFAKSGAQIPEVPDSIFVIDGAPHDWLFLQCSAVVHHGGAGTLAAGLRAGKPTLVVPFFGDQYFWGKICRNRGAGPEPINKEDFTEDGFTAALTEMLTDEMQAAATALGESIRAEDGVAKGVAALYSHLPAELMRCDLLPHRLARIYCTKTKLKFSFAADYIVHSMVQEAKVIESSNKRFYFRPVEWSETKVQAGIFLGQKVPPASQLTAPEFSKEEVSMAIEAYKNKVAPERIWAPLNELPQYAISQ